MELPPLLSIILLLPLLHPNLQVTAGADCVCALTNAQGAFPSSKLTAVEDGAARCNGVITPQTVLELDGLLLGLEMRLPQLQRDVDVLRREDDGDVYAAVSLQVVFNELAEIQQLVHKLNATARRRQSLAGSTSAQLQQLKASMEELEIFDVMQVVKRQEDNQRLKRDLEQCRSRPPAPPGPTELPHAACPHGEFVNVTGPRVYTAGEYPGSYKFGSWGRDPKPQPGQESWYWRVMLTSSNRYAHYVRMYSSLSSLIVGVSVPGNIQIHPSNPTTNTIQGPNAVLYGNALYYNCYNSDAVCRFNMTAKTVSTVELPKGTRINSKGNFCRLDECFAFTDLDLATDESGVWVTYTTSQNLGNLMLSKVEDGDPPVLGRTWSTSIYKEAVTNTFMMCSVLYATRYVDKDTEEIFYSLDTTTGAERFNLGIFIQKMQPNIYSLNYSPVDQMLHVYAEGHMISYKVLFR